MLLTYKTLKVSLLLFLVCCWIHKGYNLFRMIAIAAVLLELYVIYEVSNSTSQDSQKSD